MNKLLRLADEEPVLVVLLAGFAAVFLTVFPPHLLVTDSFLTLTAGREVAEHGLPSRDELTVLGAGRTWTDQQWGAQLLAYETYRIDGHTALTLLTAAFVVAAFVLAAVGARRPGAGPRAIVLVFFPVILAAPWAWTIRAQVFVLPLFTALVWLLASEARSPSRAAGAPSAGAARSSSSRRSRCSPRRTDRSTRRATTGSCCSTLPLRTA